LLAACGGALLGGCAPEPVRVATVAPESGMALVVGWGNTMDETVREALTPTQYSSRISKLYVASANGREIGRGINVARLVPGNYQLTIACGLYISLRYFEDSDVLGAQLDAGRVYRLHAQLNGRRCEPQLEDITGKNILN
jgi:hypothetical protein